MNSLIDINFVIFFLSHIVCVTIFHKDVSREGSPNPSFSGRDLYLIEIGQKYLPPFTTFTLKDYPHRFSKPYLRSCFTFNVEYYIQNVYTVVSILGVFIQYN